MCTVSFVPSKHGIIITSNRDEKMVRETASMPQCFEVGMKKLFYPVDGKAKGTWFMVGNDGTVGVLLNGAFKPHAVKPNYKMSRGKVLPIIFAEQNPLAALQQMDLTGIENFTLIIYHQQQLHECKWNGIQLFMLQLDKQLPHIYSSVTLYNKSMIKQRELWFDEWLQRNSSPSQETAIHFHATAGKGNAAYGLNMNRDNVMQTISITSVCINHETASLVHHNLISHQYSKQVIPIIKNEILQPC